jgi:transposase
MAISADVAVINRLDEEIERIETRLQERVAPRPELALLKTTPGIGRVLATELPSVFRLPTHLHYAANCCSC